MRRDFQQVEDGSRLCRGRKRCEIGKKVLWQKCGMKQYLPKCFDGVKLVIKTATFNYFLSVKKSASLKVSISSTYLSINHANSVFFFNYFYMQVSCNKNFSFFCFHKCIFQTILFPFCCSFLFGVLNCKCIGTIDLPHVVTYTFHKRNIQGLTFQ